MLKPMTSSLFLESKKISKQMYENYYIQRISLSVIPDGEGVLSLENRMD
jgi:hypothetical protein